MTAKKAPAKKRVHVAAVRQTDVRDRYFPGTVVADGESTHLAVSTAGTWRPICGATPTEPYNVWPIMRRVGQTDAAAVAAGVCDDCTELSKTTNETQEV